MFRRDEFIQYWKNRDKFDQGWRGFLFSTIYVGGMFLFLIPIKFISINKLFLLWPVAFLGYLIGMPRIWLRLFSGVSRKEFHYCPECRRQLREQNRLVVCATNRCGYCGTTILGD
jgi:hypothetical protein